MENLDRYLDEYADLLVTMGVNVQKGQRLVLSCQTDAAYFARKCAAAAYRAGASEVVMLWKDDAIARMRYLHADDKVFDETAEWEKHFYNDLAEEGTAYLRVLSDDPMNLLGVDPDRLLRATRTRGRDLAVFLEKQTANGFPWCIAAIPSPAWAKKVFPDLPEGEAIDALWRAIFEVVRVAGDGKATARWREHTEALERRMKVLNDYNFASLHYKNALGTDFTVGLPKGHIWMGGADISAAGVPFVANIPTEEIFTAPDKCTANGVICASMPLAHDGNIIRDIRFVVKDGKIVEATASEGEDILRNAITADEGASYFGELALVPYDSPISHQGILYYETLFDENAACHIAFGEAYPCVEGGNDMSREERIARGLNDSITHVDFMIGTKDLSITGITQDGREVPVFVDGNFAF